MQVPQQMDEQFEKMDPDSSLRPTIINVGALLSRDMVRMNTFRIRHDRATLFNTWVSGTRFRR